MSDNLKSSGLPRLQKGALALHKIVILLAALYLVAASPAFADTKLVSKYVPNAEKVGSGRLSYLMWNVYDAVLYAPKSQYNASKPYALTLTYLIEIKGNDIVASSVEEIRKQGFRDEQKLQEWEEAMRRIFPDVKKGNAITGLRDRNGHTLFYLDGKAIGRIKDKDFTKRFFAIWLDETTSEPSLRRKLLGLRR